MIAQSSIALSVMAILGFLQLTGIKERLRGRLHPYRKRGDRTILLLLGITFFSSAYYLVELNMYADSWIDKADGCRLMGQPFIPIFYVISKQFLYWFLLERASIVLDALKMHRGLFALYRNVVTVIIVVGIPCVEEPHCETKTGD
jgi:hypothetical protein